MPASASPFVAEIARLFATAGAQAYLGESVSMAEHMCQTAAAAANAAAARPLVAAALLHDIGHLIDSLAGEDRALRRHGTAGAEFLGTHFGPEVCEPVRLHVAAKRYLCATEPGYFDALSAASVHTLGLQGGPMTAAEPTAFDAEPHGRAALSLRRWDDAGKTPGRRVAGLDHYRPLVDSLLRNSHTARRESARPPAANRERPLD